MTKIHLTSSFLRGQGANGAAFTVKAAKKSETKDAAPAGLTVAGAPTMSTKRPKKEEPLQDISDLSGRTVRVQMGMEALEIWKSLGEKQSEP